MEQNQRMLILIAGIGFYVDTQRQVLKHANDRNNIILFTDLKDEGVYYSLLLDTATQKIRNGLESFNGGNDKLKQVIIPKDLLSNSLVMDDLFAKAFNQVSFTKGWNLMIADTRLQERLSGVLPTIDIAGHSFFVDLRLNSLRPKDDLTTRGIEYTELQRFPSPDGENYWFPYDSRTHRITEIDLEKLTSIPADLLLIELPDIGKLDPVGYAQKRGLDFQSYLTENPMYAQQIAKVVSWNKTALPEIIEKNKTKERSSLKAENPNQDIQRVKRKGRGI